MKTTVYYVRCSDRVYFASVQYHEAAAYRDELAAAAADQPGMCSTVHTVLAQSVTFL